MIDLYAANNTNYDMNGNMELLPLSCIVTAEINGAWTLNLTHPIDEEGRWNRIIDGAVIKVKSFNGTQLFRIKKVLKQDSGIQAMAEPIFLDAAGDCFVYDARPTNCIGQVALNSILSANPKYSASSNIAIRNTAYYVLKNAMEAIASDSDNSFLNRWGGEIEYNNFEIIINERIGQDNGIELLYGKNIPADGMRETVSTEQIVTRIIPQAFNGRLISVGAKHVDSPNIASYPTIITKVVEFPRIKLVEDVQGQTSEGDIVCETEAELNEALRSAAMEQFTDGGLDKPLVSIECDMILLQNTEEYKNFKNLESVSLGDTIHCNHSRLGIVTDARVIALEWNCLTESVERVTIGQAEANYLKDIASTISAVEKAITPEGDIIASQILGFLDASKTQLRAQSTSAEKVDAIAILFEDLDEASPTYGALAIGTQGLQVSRTRQNGEWQWGTAITSEGIIANYIVAGIISDKLGLNYWNLNTGELSTNGAIVSGGSITGSTINNGNGTFQVDANGNLTANNATIKGSIETNGSTSSATYKTSVRAGFFRTEYRQKDTSQSNKDTDIGISANTFEVKQASGNYKTQVQSQGLFTSNDGGAAWGGALTSDTIYCMRDSNNGVWITAGGNIVVKRNGSIVWSV